MLTCQTHSVRTRTVAIGTAYTVSSNGNDQFYLPVWGCNMGISSSGKSLAFGKIFKPILDIQASFDKEWEEKTAGMKESEIRFEKLKTVVFRDSHIPTLVRYVLPDSPKGVLKWADELIEWTNSMNLLSKKEGADEQFWLSTWDAASYSAIRSGKVKFTLGRPFCNVVGGLTYRKLPKLFAGDRDGSGFTFRLLFATPPDDLIADADPEYELPKEWTTIHEDSLLRLYHDLPVEDAYSEPKTCLLTPDAVKTFRYWGQLKTQQINGLEDLTDREVQSGIFGKMKMYALRFAALLHLSDKALNTDYVPLYWRDEEIVEATTMERALKLADYFFLSAIEVHERASTSVTAPPDVLSVAALMRMGKPAREIACVLWQDESEAAKRKMLRQIKKWTRMYPRVFNAQAR